MTAIRFSIKFGDILSREKAVPWMFISVLSDISWENAER